MNTTPYSIFIADSRDEMGRIAASAITIKLKYLLKQNDVVRVVFAAAPSQNEMLKYLCEAEGIDWTRVEAFHMDEYEGLPSNSPQLFSFYLNEHLFKKLPFKQVYLMEAFSDISKEYGQLITRKPIDIVCLGIGENGHIAFNDPPVADFNDPEVVKKVELDPICRMQQVNDGCFPNLQAVPQYANTLTIPVLMSARHLYCVVPGRSKREAVFQTLKNPKVTTEWPATILREHPDCSFYFDRESAGKL